MAEMILMKKIRQNQSYIESMVITDRKQIGFKFLSVSQTIFSNYFLYCKHQSIRIHSGELPRIHKLELI